MSRSDFNNDGFDDLAIGVRGETVSRLAGAGAVNMLPGSASGLTAAGDQFWSQNSPGVRGFAAINDSLSRALASGDFNNDGFSDLAIGAHFEDVGSAADAGAVNVLFGSRTGLTAVGDQIWHQNVRGVIGTAAANDHFGESLAVGDFDNDGFDDLAAGVHFKNFGAAANAGAVNVLYGSTAGLTAVGDQLWHQNVRGISSSAETDDAFGSALAVGDFNNDGFDDLASAAPGEGVGRIAGAGAVNVIRGSASGLTAAGDQIWTQDSRGIGGNAETGDGFGNALATGDFNDDGFDDLVVGVRDEGVGRAAGAGSINVLQGSSAGLSSAGSQVWTQDTRGVRGTAETDDRFGDALAVGDFDGDGFDDLAIGAPGKDVGSAENAGAVNVLYGARSGLSAAGNQLWHQNVRGVLGDADSFDFFGDSLTVGDFNNDGFDDLAIGVPGEDVGSISSGGAVSVLFGSANGLTAVGDQLWDQNVAGVLGQAGTDDLFGYSLA